MKPITIHGYRLLSLAFVLNLSACNAYFVPSLGILRVHGAVYCWTPTGSDGPDSCQRKLPEVALYECTQELKPTATWRTTSEIAEGELLQCMERKGWHRTLIAGEEIVVA
jgi:hypothetical protein